MRIGLDEYYMTIAKAVAMRSTCLRRQYGAVIVNRGEIIATGYNGNVRGEPNCSDTGICKRTDAAHNDGNYSECAAVHAEMNALLSAARKDVIGGTLYLYGMENGKQIKALPCPICRKLMTNAGIERFVGYRPIEKGDSND